jgi:hypothetical protein
MALKLIFDRTRNFIDLTIRNISKSFKESLWTISVTLVVFNPYFMILFGGYLNKRQLAAIASLILILAMIFRVADKIYNDKYQDIPIPRKKFVTDEGDMVTMENADIHELMIYMNDLQKYLEKEGLIK